MSKKYYFVLEGDIPSKKNSYRISVNGGIITYIRKIVQTRKIPPLKELLRDVSRFTRLKPPQKYRDWEANTVKELVSQTTSNMFLPEVEIWFKLYFARKGRSGGDLDNKMTSILDALTKAGIIKDDSYDCVRYLHAKGVHRKSGGGAEIMIKDLNEKD